MKDLLKKIASGILVGLAIALLTIRFAFNFCVTGIYQVYCWVLGKSHAVYWNINNEWIQYQTDVEYWVDLWRIGIDVRIGK